MSYNDSSVSTDKRHYYASSQGPFHNANNIYMFYGGGDRGTIIESIIRSLCIDNEVISVHGERGSGKTMLSLVLADRLKHLHNTIRYDHPQVSQALLLRHLLIEICPQEADMITTQQAANGADAMSIHKATQQLFASLESPLPANKSFVLTVDSTGDIDAQSLQLLEDLAALQKNGKPVMHIILFRRVETEDVRAVNAYFGANKPDHQYLLRRLTLSEIHDYLQHHMLLFDFNRRNMFTREMAYFIADRSEGVFRAINTLARNAFMIAGLEDADRLSMSHLLMAGLPPPAEPSTQQGFISRHRGSVIALFGSCVVLSVAMVVLLIR